jgi:ribonuclease BN (tRNA processing enzyme)
MISLRGSLLRQILQTFALPHPEGATAYRLGEKQKSICYVTDIEHNPTQLNQDLVGFIKETGLFIYDCTFTDATYPLHAGWGHSTWQEGLRLASAAQVGQFAIFHHNPNHTDTDMDAIAMQAEALASNVFVAKEGMRIRL